MKKYIGTKQIEAEPMTMGEAYRRGLLQAGRIPNEAEKAKAGYYVKYENGYESWSPTCSRKPTAWQTLSLTVCALSVTTFPFDTTRHRISIIRPSLRNCFGRRNNRLLKRSST